MLLTQRRLKSEPKKIKKKTYFWAIVAGLGWAM
jgi:hypothetical protein